MSKSADSSTSEFWDIRISEGRMPWDAGATPSELERYLSKGEGSGRVLIPGCGTAYEALTFAQHGYDVVAIDFSSAAVEMAKKQLSDAQVDLILGDFFSYDFGREPFDFIYERAFLASLPRRMWEGYADKVSELLRQGGTLLGYFVYGEEQDGPPFCLKEGELLSLLSENFRIVADEFIQSSVPVFAGREHWEVFEREK